MQSAWTASFRHATETRETNNIIKNPNWKEAHQLAIYKACRI